MQVRFECALSTSMLSSLVQMMVDLEDKWKEDKSETRSLRFGSKLIKSRSFSASVIKKALLRPKARESSSFYLFFLLFLNDDELGLDIKFWHEVRKQKKTDFKFFKPPFFSCLILSLNKKGANFIFCRFLYHEKFRRCISFCYEKAESRVVKKSSNVEFQCQIFKVSVFFFLLPRVRCPV